MFAGLDNAGSDDSCPDCGAIVRGGRAGCQALFDELNAQALSDPRYAAVRDLAFDAYCMQHLERYCRSAKSYAAHLSRLCCGLEYDGDPVIYAAVQKWLNGKRELTKPDVLSDLGRITVVDARAASSAEDYRRLVREWAESVWRAYSAQHEIARAWIKAALDNSSIDYERK